MAADLARRAGAAWTSREVTPGDVVAALPRIMWHLDDPLADPAIITTWFAAELAGRDVPVALAGDGADELFGGHAIYREPLDLASVSHLPGGSCTTGRAT